MKEGLTIGERAAIVREALRLIKRPDTFIQGEWKCPIYEKPKTGELVQLPGGVASYSSPETRMLTPATDEQGRPLFAYCVEGAINQAGINLLGVERAIQLGATDGSSRYGEIEPKHSSGFAEFLSVNEVARVMFADLLSQFGFDADNRPESPAQYINDDFADMEVWETEHVHVEKEESHHRVLEILRERLRQLRAKTV